MKPFLTVLTLLAVSCGLRSATISAWNFNSNPTDNSASSGSLLPSTGTGSVTRVNGPVPTFASGSATDTGADNTGANTSSYPTSTVSNKTSGLEFRVSTKGYSNVVVSFEQRASNTGSRYFRFQYSTDGSNFVDGNVIDLAPGNAFVAFTMNLTAIPAVNDNTNFAFRMVAEFESTATGAGADAYLGAVSGYSINGAIRYDVVNVAGEVIDTGNSAPTISDIPDASTVENMSTGDLLFFVNDAQSAPEQLVVTGASSDTNLVPVANITFMGTGSARSVEVTPAMNQFGSAVITVTVTDEGGLTASDSFTVTVTPANYPPALSTIAHQSTLVDTATAAIPFTVSDVETAPESLSLAATSSNPALLPLANVAFGGAGADRTVTLTPVAGQTGTAAIRVTVTDGGGRSASRSFVLMVVPTATTVLCESFSYANGPLTTNSAFFWNTHDGVAGQTLVDAGNVALNFFASEDVHAPLLGGPYGAGSNVMLYASVRVNFTGLPLAGGQYFAHFGSSTFRARLFATTAGAGANAFRLGVANGAAAQSAQVATDLLLSNSYTAVLRYNVDTAATTLWVNPNAESEPGVTATDMTSVAVIGDFSFRQTAGIGNSLVDGLKVGTRFADVVVVRPVLRITATGNDVHVFWPLSFEGFTLQYKPDLAAPDWTNYTGPVGQAGDDHLVELLGVTDNRYFRLIK